MASSVEIKKRSSSRRSNLPRADHLRRGLSDELGIAICNGEIPAGRLLRIDDIVDTHQVSRSVVREAFGDLRSRGLLKPRRGLGTIVLDASHWNPFDRRVIEWRLQGNDQENQLKALAEFRLGMEPTAAGLAARRADDERKDEILQHARLHHEAALRGDRGQYLQGDRVFHRIIAESSGNSMFLFLHPVIDRLITSREEFGLMPTQISIHAAKWHVELGEAICTGDSAQAEAIARNIAMQALEELAHLYSVPSEHDDSVGPH